MTAPHLPSTASPADRLRVAAVLAGSAFALVLNWLAGTGPLLGVSTGEISDALPNLFVPAGYVFAIWGVIYLGWLAFVLWHSLPAQRADPIARAVGWPFALSGLLNGAWLVAWHARQLEASLAVMLGLLATLAWAYARLDPFRAAPTRAVRWAVLVPFGLYLGWISVATIANATAVLVGAGFRGGGLPEPAWSAALMFVGAMLALVVALPRRDAAWLAVLVWAYPGIAAAHGEVSAVVAGVAWMLAAGLALASLRAATGAP